MSNNNTAWSKYIEALKKSAKDIEALDKGLELDSEPEEWIWVEGYKATDKNMVCRDKQFRMHVQHDMPEGAAIVACESGFHFCRDLKDVFNYYNVQDGNRFFRVRALVRKRDYELYGLVGDVSSSGGFSVGYRHIDKLASKSIIFLYELTPVEILKNNERMWEKVKDYTPEEMKEVVENSYAYVQERKDTEKLVAAGYSAAFSKYIASMSVATIETALAVATQPELSMDMKVLTILRAILREEYD